MLPEHDLVALLNAYIAGDLLGRKVLVDALEEAGDERAAPLRDEAINWDKLAKKIAGDRSRHSWLNGEAAHVRFLIECARYGSPTRPEVTEAVEEARRAFVRKLFPDVEL